MRIYLIRHGQSVRNAEGRAAGHGDTPLTDQGRGQAKQAGVCLRDVLGVSLDAIYASTLSRTYDTACCIAQEMGIDEVIGDDRLQERYIAHFSGMLKTDLPKETRIYQDVGPSVSKGWITHKDVESDDSLINRVQAGIDDIYKNHPDGEVVVVAHGGNIVYRLGSQGYDASRGPDNAGITVLDYHPGDLQVISYSLNDHLL